jgi:hypothetical protein
MRFDLTDSTEIWTDISQKTVAYFRPRLLSAGKLALRGVQLNSMPLSMSDCSDFAPLQITAAVTTPPLWNSPQGRPVGWAPIVIVNPDTAPIMLLITIEWRVRFDISNPAVSSHTHHGVTSDVAWDGHIQAATRALPGVLDIVEKVANTGLGVAKAYGAYAAMA